MKVIIWDSAGARLSPLTDLRASFDVRTGALTTFERMRLEFERAGTGEITGLIVPPPIRAITAARHPDLAVNDVSRALGGEKLALVVDGSCPVAALPELRLGDIEPLGAIFDTGGSFVAGVMVDEVIDSLKVESWISETSEGGRRLSVPRLTRPWDVVRHRDECLARDLELLSDGSEPLGATAPPAGATIIESERLMLARDASIGSGVVLDATRGAIAIASGATIGHHAIIEGPVAIGRDSVITARAHVKANTVIGPVCKVGGEVGGTIFQGYANKSHEGHLGDSWVGEWVNLGANTNNSNLLNTYGEVKASAVPAVAEASCLG
ncbi:MAG: putative sugar nucleotidyl transferase, partial [Planctomycetota bacterium]